MVDEVELALYTKRSEEFITNNIVDNVHGVTILELDKINTSFHAFYSKADFDDPFSIAFNRNSVQVQLTGIEKTDQVLICGDAEFFLAEGTLTGIVFSNLNSRDINVVSSYA
ncbi:MAG: hypothetical protein AAGA08_16630 [Pseudomonadota bacterium]